MSKLRLALSIVVAVMFLIAATSCFVKVTEIEQGYESGGPVDFDDGGEPPVIPEGMVYVPCGIFTMGNTSFQGMYNEQPAHEVALSSFFIGKYEVTQAEYSQYMQADSCWTSEYGLGDNYPAYNVSWYDAIKYCNLRSMAEGLTPCYKIFGGTDPANWGSPNSTWNGVTCDWNANGYRLPTEAEWEYAARGATDEPNYLCSGSDDADSVAWYHYNSEGTSHPVGTKAPNGIGTYDMSGNVMEWCWDWYFRYFKRNEPLQNPIGPKTGTSRLLRGGCWCYSAAGCSVSSRIKSSPSGSGYNYIGFRVCRSIR